MDNADKLNFRGKFRQYDADGKYYLYKIGDTVELNGKRFVAIKPTSSMVPGTQQGVNTWRSIGSDDNFYISETVPLNALIGDRWYIPSTETLYTYVQEENSKFWVEL